MKTAAEYKRELRKQKRKQGYILKQIWVKPEHWEKIKECIEEGDQAVR